MDPASVEMFKSDASSTNFLANNKSLWETTKPLAEFASNAADTYDAIFIPGGHGPMFDLATDPTSQKIIAAFAEKGKVVASVCHGPAAFVNVKLSDGTHLLKGKEVTGFSNTEEDQMDYSKYMPFMLVRSFSRNLVSGGQATRGTIKTADIEIQETKLNEESGGKYVKAAEPWGEKVVVAGNVITGQNPASAHKVGEEIVKALKA